LSFIRFCCIMDLSQDLRRLQVAPACARLPAGFGFLKGAYVFNVLYCIIIPLPVLPNKLKKFASEYYSHFSRPFVHV